MNDIPFEIYYNIFHYLSRPQIRICSFVCKRLNDAAVQVYNRKLIIDDYKVRLAKVSLSNGDADAYFKNGHLVREVVFKGGNSSNMGGYSTSLNVREGIIPRFPRFYQREFLVLLQYLPNIEEIDLSKSDDFTIYISFLFFANLQRVTKITALPFESTFGLSNHSSYFNLCFKFRETLTSLYLEYTEKTKSYTCGGMGILDMLRQFKNLNQLKFYNDCASNLIMFQIQELVPQLAELRFTDTSICKRKEKRLNQRVEATTKINKNLQRLHIILKSFSTDYIKYLTSYLAEKLHTVDIKVKSSGLFHWIEEFGMKDVLKLMQKLGQQNHVCIFFPPSPTSRRSGSAYDSKMAKWFQVVNAFRGDKKALCTVKFNESRSSQEYFEYRSSDNQLVFAQSIERADYYEPRIVDYYDLIDPDYERQDFNYYGSENVDDDELENVDDDEIENAFYQDIEYVYGNEREDAYYYWRRSSNHNYQPYDSSANYCLHGGSISTIGPEIIDRLELTLEPVSDSCVEKFLDYAFKNCINLQYLKFTNYFQIQGCPNQKNKDLNGIQNNLKMVHFFSTTPTNNILNIIFKYLPDIEVLVLGSHRRYNSNLDLTLFKSLKRCYTIIQNTSDYSCEALNVKFEYTDGKKQRYYYDGTVKKTLVREDRQTSINLCRSLTFTCKKDTEFIVCFGCEESLLDFDINKHHDSRCHIPMGII